ncbi:MAG TPA: PIN domain-containing protein [Bacteroidales bacterium]|nr:PIN domain-containing protein [Bacteroidales bacterium]HRX97595.1 PIN domain-containing protein [Bacteroidales bacterium]
MEKLIFLDTHVLIWLYAGKLKLFSNLALREIRKSNLCFSPVVKLELRYLYEIGKISEKPDKIVNALKQEIGLKEANDDFAAVVNEAINQGWTRDPFDRIISAQAKIRNVKLLTKDQTILSNCNFAFWE